MYLFRFIWILVFNLVLAAYCWGSASSPGERAARNAENNLNKLYFNYVFAEENERLLRAIMVSVRRLYDRNELEKSLESHSAPDHQIADRQQLLTDLVQQATRHAIAKINGSDELGNSDLPMFHILQALSNAPSMQESLDVVHWYSTQPVLLNGVMAEDRMDSLENLIQEAVHNSFREFPSNPPSREQLARQLGFILLEMQELFLRGKVLRSLSYKIDKQKQNPKIASDPAFKIYLSLLTETFNKNPTLWHTNSKGRQYQEDLSALFIKAADREDYGNEWYQQIRKILDGQKPVRVTPPPSDQRSARHHYDDDDDEEEGWFELTPLRVVLGVGAIYGGFLTIIACLAIFGSDTESAMRERRQEEELQEKLGKALYKPGQKGAKRKGAKRKGLRPRKGNKPGQQDSEDEEQYPKPTKKTLKEIIDIKKTVSDRLWDNLMYRVGIEAGVLSPLCAIWIRLMSLYR